MCYIYIYDVYLVCNDGRLKPKKIKFFHFFAECHDHDTRQSWESGTLNFPALPSAMVKALGKENPKKRKQALPSARCRHSAKHFFKKIKNIFLCRAWHSGNPLPSAVVALGKSFAECPTCGTRQRSLCREGIC